jgi:hypothetical protein
LSEKLNEVAAAFDTLLPFLKTLYEGVIWGITNRETLLRYVPNFCLLFCYTAYIFQEKPVRIKDGEVIRNFRNKSPKIYY